MRIINILAAITILTIVACSTKKAMVSNSNSSPNFDTQLSAIKSRFPDATTEELKMGHGIYTGACTRCHGQKEVTGYTEEKLLGIVDVMAKKAAISAKEKQALIRFAVGVRSTAAK